MKTLGEVRNNRGDISHGRLSPKEEVSTPELARLVFDMTKAFLTYILNIFFAVKRKQIAEETKYEDNEEFNNYLDEQNELEGKLSYIRALFDQDNLSYIGQFESFTNE